MAKQTKDIELELRAEIAPTRFNFYADKFRAFGKQVSVSRRLSVMFFGTIGGKAFDIRVRTDDKGFSEIVCKKGDYHSHNRIEYSEMISKKQILGFAKIFFLLGLNTKVTERDNFVFDFPNEITVTITRAQKICYIEFEKMTHEASAETTRRELAAPMAKFNLSPLNKTQFTDICRRLDEKVDWQFGGSPADFKKLSELLEKY